MRIEPRQRRSRHAFWSRRLAIAGLAILAATIAGHRAHYVATDAAVVLIIIGVALAALAVLAALSAFAAIWRDGRAGGDVALQGLLLALVLLVYPAILTSRMATLPAIDDVTTDAADPLVFVAIRWRHPAPEGDAIAAQQAAYPAVVSRRYPVDAQVVFAALTTLIEERGWQVERTETPMAASPPIGEVPIDPGIGPADMPIEEPAVATAEVSQPGWIEAVARTPIVAFPEDVVIRVMPDQAGTIVDVRSAGRAFFHDFGSNAQRIADLFDDLDERLTPRTAD